MEKNRGIPRIIEFNGLPGSGKSTIARCLKKQIEAKLQETATCSYYRYKWQSNPYSVLLSPRYYRLVYLILLFSKTFKKKKLLSVILNLVKYYRIYKTYLSDKSNGFLIIDEGIIQMIVSVAFKDKIIETEWLKKVVDGLEISQLPILIVNCVLDTDNTEIRLLNRPANGCRLEDMSSEEMRKTLRVQSENFSMIRSFVNKTNPGLLSITINTMESPELNASRILSFLQNL